MPYLQQTWINDDASTPLSADRMIHIEQGVGTAQTTADDASAAAAAALAATSAESIQDVVGALLIAGANITLTYNDAGNQLTVASTAATDTEAVQDIIGTMVANAGGTYNDAAGTITFPSSTGTDTEAVQDIIGAMVVAAGGTYNDAAGTLTLPAGPPGPPGVSGDASVALADVASFIDEPVQAGVAIGEQHVVSAISAAFAWIDLTLPPATAVTFTIKLSDGTFTGGTATVAAGGYRAIFPTAVAYPADSVLFPIPGLSGGGGARLRHKTDTAQTIPTAPNVPTGVAASPAVNGITTVSWTPPGAGVTPLCYTIWRNPVAGGGGVPIIGRAFGTAIAVAGHTAGDTYAVESVVLGRGSGPSGYVATTGGGGGPSRVTKSSTGVADGTTIPALGTSGADWTATAAVSGSTAVYTGGKRVLTTGTASSTQRAKSAGLGTFTLAGGGWVEVAMFMGDAGATSWVELIDSSVTDPTSTANRYLRLQIPNASAKFSAKAPATSFSGGTAGNFTDLKKTDATTSTNLAVSVGSTGAAFFIEATVPDGTGAMTLNLHQATIANADTAYPGNQTTLVHTVPLTATEAQGLFGTPGSPISMYLWEGTTTSNTTPHTVSYGPTDAYHVGA